MRERSKRVPRCAAAVAAAGIVLLLAPGCRRGAVQDPRLRVESAVVRLSIEETGAERGDFYTYASSRGTAVKFLVYRESTGAVRAVLDACRSCYRWRKGYALEGDTVVCRRCSERLDLDGLIAGRASCTPIPLSAIREGDDLVIPLPELEAGAKFF